MGVSEEDEAYDREQSINMKLMKIQSQLSQIDGFLKGLVEGLNMRLDHIEKQLKQIN